MALRPVPYPYRHPSKGPPQRSVEDDTRAGIDASSAKRVERTIAQDAVADRLVSQRRAPVAPSVTVKVSFPIHLLCRSAAFEAMVSDGVPERIAALRLGRRAIDDWLAGSDPLEVPDPYALAPDATTVETTRRLPASRFDSVERGFDPHGIHSARLLGRMFGHAVLMRWLDRTKT